MVTNALSPRKAADNNQQNVTKRGRKRSVEVINNVIEPDNKNANEQE